MSRPEWCTWPKAIEWKSDPFAPDRYPGLQPREEPYGIQEIWEIMFKPPISTLPRFLTPDDNPELLPPRFCYGWPLSDLLCASWASVDVDLRAWTQNKKLKRFGQPVDDDEPEEEWDPNCDDYVNYYVTDEDKWGTYLNVVHDWAKRAGVELPLHNNPVVRVMAHGKAYWMFALYDNYHLEDRLEAEQIDAIRAVWSVNRYAHPQWYPVLPTATQDFQWTRKARPATLTDYTTYIPVATLAPRLVEDESDMMEI